MIAKVFCFWFTTRFDVLHVSLLTCPVQPVDSLLIGCFLFQRQNFFPKNLMFDANMN